MPSFQSDGFQQQRRVSFGKTQRKSRSATWALRLAWLPVSPLAPLAGMVLGFRSCKAIGKRKDLFGRRTAMAAMFVGLLMTIVQGAVGWRIYEYDAALRRTVPVALEAAFMGDAQAFADCFAEGDAQEAQAFVDSVRSRYGAMQECHWSGALALPKEPVGWTVSIEMATLRAESTVSVSTALDETCLSSSLGSIVIKDVKRGDLVYPRAMERMAAHE